VISLRRAPVSNNSLMACAATWFGSASMEAKRRLASSGVKYRSQDVAGEVAMPAVGFSFAPAVFHFRPRLNA
jgi:hypothetical protein